MRLKTIIGCSVTGMGTILSIVGAYQVRSVLISIDAEFGLANYLPIFFWVGFFTLLIGVYIIKESHNGPHHLCALSLLAIVIWCLPVFTNELPYHKDVFRHISVAQWIGENNQLTFKDSRIFYLQYPALFLFTATLILIGAPNDILIMNLYPIFLTVIFTINFFLLTRELLNCRKKAFVATLLGLIGNVGFQSNHFSPSATAQAFFPLLVYMTLRTETSKQKVYWSSLVILSFFYILLHPLMSILYVITVFSLVVYSNLPFRTTKRSSNDAINYSTLLLLIVTYFGWGVFVASWGFTELSQSLNRFVSVVLELGKESSLSSEILPRQTIAFPIVGYIKRIIFLLFVAPALVLFVRSLLRKSVSKVGTVFFTTFTFWLLSALVSILSDRILVWIIPFAVLVLANSNIQHLSWRFSRHLRRLRKEAFLLTFLLSITPLTFLTYYSGGAVYVTTKAEYVGFSYLTANLKEGDRVLVGFAGTLYFFNHYNMDYVIYSPPSQYTAESLDRASVISFLSSSYAWQYMHEGTALNSYMVALNGCDKNSHLNRVYSNVEVIIFRLNTLRDH